MQKLNTKEALLACAMASAAILVLILIIFTLNFRSQKATFTRSLGSVGVLAAQENAKEQALTYYDAGHNYVYQVENGTVTAVMAYAPSHYPFAFACGSSIKVGNSVNLPLMQGDVLFQEYPRGNVYPTWNKTTGVYKEISNLSEMNLSVSSAKPVSLTGITTLVAIQKESCLTMTAGASIVTIGFLIAYGAIAMNFVRRSSTSQR